ncbi:WD40 repeat domain-containing protein [filamentous cyanobacterium LEGE 11480]|uniref:WD40 repeat domain-containing protein n=1 Tax=Romeriopsis navalis LEGE 11480 TaxID=2777977 RepID=A0A928VQQ3_9CYAN|nr:WD40 repeat domain-containing protein [Romeriopsis navalis]MBE9032760.1 WD40 repeat domain-containing protein [Romeriopsis navalis LEGE 11480]
MKIPKIQLNQHWHSHLSDYITKTSWSPDGTHLAASSASGEVALYKSLTEVIILRSADENAINSLSFSANGQFLAVGGQSGEVIVWDIHTPNCPIVLHRSHPGKWIDQLAWHPEHNHLAYGSSSQVQVWDIATNTQITELEFQNSSVLHLTWHPAGKCLTASGHGGMKIWFADDWQRDFKLIEVPGASLWATWSGDGRYLASGNLDRTLTVAEWDSPPPWLMQGFPGKVNQLDWSTQSGAPLLAASCVEAITVWQRGDKSESGWQSQVLKHHRDRVNAIAFQPDSRLLASASQDGQVALWHNGKRLAQVLQNFTAGASCLAWHPNGQQLAAGGSAGEIQVWQIANRAKGFGSAR